MVAKNTAKNVSTIKAALIGLALSQPGIDPQIEATVEQRCIDDQISQLHARICALRTKRNTYARISQLPAEIIAEIFLHTKRAAECTPMPNATYFARERCWLQIVSVCTYWRETALNCPRLWSTIELDPVERASRLIKRTKSVPLFISCSELDAWRRGSGMDQIAPIVMSNIHRIQELDVGAIHSEKLFDFLQLNQGASAPILKVLTLRGHISSLPRDILERPMNSLQELQIDDGTLTFPLPPIPQLKRLLIRSDPSRYNLTLLAFDVLLHSLGNTPNIEELLVHQLHAPVDASMDTNRPVVHLPRLTCIEIHGPDIGSSKLFSFLKHPQTANIVYRCEQAVIQGEDISGLQHALVEFASLPGRVIHRISVQTDYLFKIALEAVTQSSSHSLVLTLGKVHEDPFVQLLSVTPSVCKAPSLDLSRRKHLGMGIEELTIRHSGITKDIANQFRQYVKVDVDYYQTKNGDEEDSGSGDEDEDDLDSCSEDESNSDSGSEGEEDAYSVNEDDILSEEEVRFG
ncbi:hypothetical protein ONZ45_g9782 [Pleurotus djamor]|nr:hypothetical protein ONZ45_g9782 [Pleurotus djamor]